jgi:hypothetical protein
LERSRKIWFAKFNVISFAHLNAAQAFVPVAFRSRCSTSLL